MNQLTSSIYCTCVIVVVILAVFIDVVLVIATPSSHIISLSTIFHYSAAGNIDSCILHFSGCPLARKVYFSTICFLYVVKRNQPVQIMKFHRILLYFFFSFTSLEDSKGSKPSLFHCDAIRW